MWKKTGKFIFLSVFLLVAAAGICSAAPEVSMSVSQKEVLFGDSAVLTITIRGVDNPDRPVVPYVPGLEVKFRGVRQESFSSFTMIVQGKQIQKKTEGGGHNFEFELMPKRKGLISVPAFSVEAGGKTFLTNPFELKVIDETLIGSDIFARVQIDKTTAYLGEKILLTFKWYLDKDIGGYKINIPWLEGLKNFLITDPELTKKRAYLDLVVNGNQHVPAFKNREFFKGHPYTVISFQKVLTPISIGVYDLEPVFVKCDIVTGYEKKSRRQSRLDNFFDSDFSDFFGSGRRAITKPVAVRSNQVQITVREVPVEGRPSSYNGAVGEFDFSVDLKPSRLKTGEPVTVTMKVSGSGNIEQLELPPFLQPEGFKSYEPESKTDVSQKGGTVIGTKLFEKVLVPKEDGDFSIPRISFTFFNPRKEKYETINRGPFNIHVEKGEQDKEVQVIALTDEGSVRNEKRKIKILKKDIRYIKTDIGKTAVFPKEIYERPFVWIGAFAFPSVLVLGIFLLQRRRERYLTDVSFARSKNAFKKIRDELAEAERALNKDETRIFYDSLSKALNSYLADKLNRQQASINSKVVNELSEMGLDSKLTGEMDELYRTFEMALFSSVVIEREKMRADYMFTRNLISSLERILK